MTPVYDKIADRYDRMHSTWLRHAGGAAQAAFEASVLARLRPGTRMLDAGCGTGEFARHLCADQGADIDLTLFDASAAMLRKAADIPACRRQGCLSQMPFATGHFDLVAAAWSIEATDAPYCALSEMVRVLRPGGTLITVFCARRPKVAPLARALQMSVELRGTGRFLSDQSVRNHLATLGVEALTQLRVSGPAAVLTCRKSMAQTVALAA